MTNNFKTFSYHQEDEGDSGLLALNVEKYGLDDKSSLNPETAAREYLQEALMSPQLGSFEATEVNQVKSEFKSVGTETLGITGTTIVKFRQTLHGISIYGSLISVELDETNGLLSLNSSMGEPKNINPIAKISPSEVAEIATKYCSSQEPISNQIPLLYFYVDQKDKWRLVYILKDIVKHEQKEEKEHEDHGHDHAPIPNYISLVIDAHSGEVVREMPRVANASSSGKDELGVNRRFGVKKNGSKDFMQDEKLGVVTYNFNFNNIQYDPLPGDKITNPPAWTSAAVSAHANASQIAEFVRTVLKRNGIDNKGLSIVSNINCLYHKFFQAPDPNNEWRNAAWIGALKQMVYGQRILNGRLVSYAVAADVVAHEVFHGITDTTANLEYLQMPGALNESYSDIFGIIITNFNRSIDQWDWELGEDLNTSGIPIRNIKDPTKHNQPAHMDQYQNLPDSYDHGGVHINSGIHNKAAYNVITSKDGDGNFLFTPSELAQLFYIALATQLTKNSDFSASLRGLVSAGKTLFRRSANKREKVAAIIDGFNAAGIT